MTPTRCALAVTLALIPLLAGCLRDDPEQLLRSGRQYLAQADVGSATIQLKNAVREQPENGEARLLLGRALLQVGDPEGAEKELRRALELGQPPDEVVPLLAQALLQLGEPQQLVREFGERKLTAPRSQADLQASLGDANAQLRRLPEATSAYRAALELQPDDTRAQLGLAQLDAIAGKLDAALAATDKVIAAAPKTAQAHALKAEILNAQGDRAAARRALQQALDADPAYLPARFALIASMIDANEMEAARAELGKAAERAPGDIRVVYFDGVLAQRAGNTERARDNVSQVLKVAPDHMPSLMLAAVLDLQANKPASAEANLRRVLARSPGHREANRLLIMSYLRAGEPVRARAVLEPWLQRAGTLDSQTLLLAGETYLANGDVAQASEFFQRAAKADETRSRAVAHTRLGQIALAGGRAEEGLRDLATASALDPELRHADLALISSYMRSGEFDKALEAARNLEKRQPKDALSHQVLGMVHLGKRDPAAARRSFVRALELDPAYLPAARALGTLDVDEGKTDDARRRFAAMIQKNPRSASLHLALAEVLARSGAPVSEVLPTLQRAVEADPGSVDARLALITAQRQSGAQRAALASAQQAVTAHPDNPQLLLMLSALQEEAGEHNQAVETLRRLAQLQPASTQPLQRLAAVHARSKDFDKAIEALRTAKELAPQDLNLSRDLILVQLMAARPAEALKEAKSVQAASPRLAAGWLLESQVHEHQKRADDAERALRAGLKVEPASGLTAVRLHSVLTGASKTAEATAFTRKWLADQPRDTVLRSYLAERELAAKNYPASAELYRQVIDIDPNNVIALNNLAWISGQLSDPKALSYAERAVKLAPNSAPVLDTMGVLLVERGEAVRGVDFLARATRIAPNRHDIRLNYARALARAGNNAQARRELEALMAVPDQFAGKSEIPTLLKSL
jgi:cellulose synthase operon protein C